MTFKPLLAAPVEFEHLDYTNLWVSPKLDGIRAIIIDGVVVSRSLKPIPNKHVQALFGNRPELEGYDGELIVGPANANDVYRVTNSGVMAVEGEPDAVFHAFDHTSDPNEEYYQRRNCLQEFRGVVKVPQHPAESYEAVLEIEAMYLLQGYEGVMLRAFTGPSSFYKYGRSTARATTLLKLKRFTDAEAIVLGVEEEMQNNNEATTNALGRTERSSHAENKLGKGRLGALICRTEDGVQFKIGTGFDHAQRNELWSIKDALPGQYVKYKSFDIGVKTAPRFPTFLGMRNSIDMA